ncbi:MAG: cyclase family protein [Bacteroidetes bacterium]|nr:cyclase family protein [Bacteroidota bacterium]
MVTRQQKIIDLTNLLNEKITVYPDTENPEFKVINTVEKDGFSEHRIKMVSHTGTHIDAPSHIFKNGKTLGDFPIDKFVGKAMVIPCQGRREIGLNYIKFFEEQIRQVDFVLFFTGWQEKWNTENYFDDCPTPTVEAALWLAQFNLKGVGVDAFSLDKIVPALKVTFENLPNHYIFLEKEILFIENLTNLDKLPDAGFTFICLPLKIENADGSPVRAVAMTT